MWNNLFVTFCRPFWKWRQCNTQWQRNRSDFRWNSTFIREHWRWRSHYRHYKRKKWDFNWDLTFQSVLQNVSIWYIRSSSYLLNMDDIKDFNLYDFSNLLLICSSKYFSLWYKLFVTFCRPDTRWKQCNIQCQRNRSHFKWDSTFIFHFNVSCVSTNFRQHIM